MIHERLEVFFEEFTEGGVREVYIGFGEVLVSEESTEVIKGRGDGIMFMKEEEWLKEGEVKFGVCSGSEF